LEHPSNKRLLKVKNNRRLGPLFLVITVFLSFLYRMPRVYKKKSGTCGARPYRSKYTDQQMEAAIKAVESGS